MDISKRLRNLREQCVYIQNGSAKRVGVSQSHLRREELCQTDISVGHLQLLCDAMNISLKIFFEFKSVSDKITATFPKLSPKTKLFYSNLSRVYNKVITNYSALVLLSFKHNKRLPSNRKPFTIPCGKIISLRCKLQLRKQL